MPGKQSKLRSTSEDEISLKSIDDKLNLILSEVTEIKSLLDKVEKNQKDQEKSIAFMLEENDMLKKKGESLEQRQIKLESNLLCFDNLNHRLELNEHQARGKCIELNGIPYGKGENLLEGFEELVKKLKNFHCNLFFS